MPIAATFRTSTHTAAYIQTLFNCLTALLPFTLLSSVDLNWMFL
jgi:hypothetical protein